MFIIISIEYNFFKLKYFINLSGLSEYIFWNEFLMSSLMILDEVFDKYE